MQKHFVCQGYSICLLDYFVLQKYNIYFKETFLCIKLRFTFQTDTKLHKLIKKSFLLFHFLKKCLYLCVHKKRKNEKFIFIQILALAKLLL
jgi:hypothetical protein